MFCQFVRLRSSVTVACDEVKDVDYLLMANPVVQLNHSGIRHDCASFQDSRSLVVLTEGRDPRPPDVESSAQNL